MSRARATWHDGFAQGKLKELLRVSLLLCMLFSLAIHALILLFVPGISAPPLPAETYTEVELREISVPPPQVEIEERITPPEPPQEPVAEPAPPAPEPAIVAEVPPPPPIAEEQVAAMLDEGEISLGLTMQAPTIEIEVPLAKAPDLKPEISLPEETGYAVEALFEKLGGATLPPGSLEGRELSLQMRQIEKLEREPTVEVNLGDLTAPARAPRENALSIRVPAAVIGADVQIRGPASGRGSPIYWPPSPEIAVGTETLIMLKFWVLPDGRVGQVLPVRVDEGALGAEAVKFVSALRFRPLASFEKQEKQWGLISLIFKPQ